MHCYLVPLVLSSLSSSAVVQNKINSNSVFRHHSALEGVDFISQVTDIHERTRNANIHHGSLTLQIFLLLYFLQQSDFDLFHLHPSLMVSVISTSKLSFHLKIFALNFATVGWRSGSVLKV